MAQIAKYSLPWPPSVNHYWRMVGRMMIISKEGREYRQTVNRILRNSRTQPMVGRLSATIFAFPPDARRRDLDNLLKSLLDAMQHGRAYADDGQIDCLMIERFEPTPGGKVEVEIMQRTTK